MEFKRFRQWLVAQAALGLLGLLKILPADFAINSTAGLARRIGPRLRRHKLVIANLRNAFPEKSSAEIDALALESWEHLGRMAAEYIFFEKIFAFDQGAPHAGRVDVTGEDVLADLKNNPRPFLFMTAHTGNFESLPYVATAKGIPVAVLFRPPNNPYIAEHLARLRGLGSDRLVPSQSGSSKVMFRQLEAGQGIGILVDQKFEQGIETTFFGQPAKTNPLVPKLSRHFKCDVIPVRSIRIAGNRYRIEVEPPLILPRNAAGEIDIDAAAQAMNDKVESWVRQHPEQWLWYHDRWSIKRSLR